MSRDPISENDDRRDPSLPSINSGVVSTPVPSEVTMVFSGADVTTTRPSDAIDCSKVKTFGVDKMRVRGGRRRKKASIGRKAKTTKAKKVTAKAEDDIVDKTDMSYNDNDEEINTDDTGHAETSEQARKRRYKQTEKGVCLNLVHLYVSNYSLKSN